MNTHPAIAAALAQLAPPQSKAHILKAYHDLLSTMDWQYQFSDDQAVWRKGVEQVKKARALQAEVDPDGSIWMSYSGAHMHGAPKPVVKR